MKQGKSHYTPQEFARLFHIDKQTLIYYDNQGIFSPAFRSEKGYRYYEAARSSPLQNSYLSEIFTFRAQRWGYSISTLRAVSL